MSWALPFGLSHRRVCRKLAAESLFKRELILRSLAVCRAMHANARSAP